MKSGIKWAHGAYFCSLYWQKRSYRRARVELIMVGTILVNIRVWNNAKLRPEMPIPRTFKVKVG